MKRTRKVNKNTAFLFFVFLLVTLLVWVGCNQTSNSGGDDDGGGSIITTTINPILTTTTTTNSTNVTFPVANMNALPGRYSLKIPASILSTGGSNGSRSRGKTESLHKESSRVFNEANSKRRGKTRAEGEKSFGYVMLQSLAGWVYDNNKDVARNFVILDELIAQDNLTPSTEYNDTKYFRVTPDMIEKIKFFADNYNENDDFWLSKGYTDYDTWEEYPDDYEFVVPAFLYLEKSQFSNAILDPTINTEGYDKMILMNYYKYFSEWDVESDPFFVYVLWTNTNNVRVIWDWKSVDDPFRMDMYYNLEKNIAGMIMIYENYPWVYDEEKNDYFENRISGEKEKSLYSIIIQGVDYSKNAIMVKSISKTVSSEKSDEFILEGYIDDNGGYCEYSFASQNLRDRIAMSILEKGEIDRYRDQFDGSGNMTGGQEYNDEPDSYWGYDIGWNNFDDTLNWSNTNYDDQYDVKVANFANDIIEIKAEEPVKENLKADQFQVTLKLPDNIKFNEGNAEVKKTFAITRTGEPPLQDGSNIVGYQTITKEDFEKNKDKPVSMILNGIEPGDVQNRNDIKLYEVEYNKVEIGTTNPTTIVNVAVKATTTIIKTATGLFNAGSLEIAKDAVKPAIIKVPNADTMTWAPNEKKLMVITNNGLAPKSDGSNVIGMTRLTETSAKNPNGVGIPLDKNKTGGSTELGTFVYPSDGQNADGTPQFGGADAKPDNTNTILKDKNGDGSFDDKPEGEEEEEDEIDEAIPEPVVTASTNNPDHIIISWTWNEDGAYEEDIEGFRIRYVDKVGETYPTFILSGKTLATLGANDKEYKDTTVEMNKDRKYAVEAYTKVGAGDILNGIAEGEVPLPNYSNGGIAEGKRAGEKPQTPTAVDASDTTTDGIIITWTVSDEEVVDSYKIYRSESPDGPYEKIDNIPDVDGQTEKYIDRSVGAAVKYYYQIKSVDHDNDNAESDASIQTDGIIPKKATPDNLIASINNGDGIDLTWDPVEGADFYLLYRRQKDTLKPDAPYQQLGGKITDRKYRDTSVKPYKDTEPFEYEYQVTACKEKPANESEKSTMTTGRRANTDRPAPSGLRYKFKQDSGDRIVVEWDKLQDPKPDKMDLYISHNSGASWEAYNSGTIGTKLTEVLSTEGERGTASGSMKRYKLIAEWNTQSGPIKKDSNIITIENQSPFQPATGVSATAASNGQATVTFTLPWSTVAPGSAPKPIIQLQRWDATKNSWVRCIDGYTSPLQFYMPFDRVNNQFQTTQVRIEIQYKDDAKKTVLIHSVPYTIPGFKK